MNAKFNGENWVVEVTAKQFRKMVEEFFKRNPFPSCDELIQALVPVGVPNTADEGHFGPYGIFKYSFVSFDGIGLMVKYHKPDSKVALKHPKANSALFWTAQIICDDALFFGWETFSRKASTVKVGAEKAQRGNAPKEDRCHIPLRNGPSIGSRGQVIIFEAVTADNDSPDSFVSYIMLCY